MAEINGEFGNEKMKNDIPYGGELPMTDTEPVGTVGKAASLVSSAEGQVDDVNSGFTESSDTLIINSCHPLNIVKEGSCSANTDKEENLTPLVTNGPVGGSNPEAPDSTQIRNYCDKTEEDKIFDDDLSNKVKVVFNFDGLKETGGLLYIGCKDEIRKTNPSKIAEWFTPEFLNLHGVYAIKEEEPFLLRVFTRNHESTNRGIRKKGGRKVMLMGQEVFGDVLLACGHCGYWSHEGSNVRRHLKKSVCLKERGYTKEDLAGLDRIERRRFLRRVAAAKCRAKKRAKDIFPECLVEIQENCCGRDISLNGSCLPPGTPSVTLVSRLSQPKGKRKPPKHKALTLGPAIVQEVVQRVPFDIYTVNENNERVAWKPPSCHKSSLGDEPCQIVFKGARMKRRCMDLPIPLVLIYRKLDCKLHHCNFTLFHPNSRNAFKNDPAAKASVNLKMYGDMVMTQEFYHYFVSLLSIMKMKSSQTARHLTSVWETIIAERLGRPSIPDEYRKIITLSKQTVKSLWSSIEEEVGNKGGARLMKGPRRKKKPQPPPAVPTMPPPPNITGMNPQASIGVGSCGVATVQVNQPGMQHHCMKRINHMPPKVAPPAKPPMMGPPPHNHIQQPPPQIPVNHPHWLSQGPQYPHNMAHYPMAPPPAAEYYPMPGHFMAQYTPATMGLVFLGLWYLARRYPFKFDRWRMS
ncbi:uncharacterized protein [Palaemon carinicauda]|uniref:uncharacterized protein n=1 Tax=Palaemon carinicauda TaxID=392227 RepID=UPI0035B5A40A